MSDLTLTASLDFRQAQAQVNTFVNETKKKFAEIMAAANRPGGSLAGGKGAAGTLSMISDDKRMTKVREQLLDTHTRRRNRILAQGYLRERAMAEGNFRLMWKLMDQHEKEVARSLKSGANQLRDEMRERARITREGMAKLAQIEKGIQSSRTSASTRQSQMDAAYALREREDAARKASQIEAMFSKKEKEEREARVAEMRKNNAVMRSEISGFNKYVEAERKAQLAAVKEAAKQEQAAINKTLAQRRQALLASRKMSFTVKETSNVVGGMFDNVGTNRRAAFADHYNKQEERALIAQEKARREVERAEARIAALRQQQYDRDMKMIRDTEAVQRRADKAKENAIARIRKERDREIAEEQRAIKRAEVARIASYKASDRAHERVVAAMRQRERAETSGSRAAIRTIGGAENTALGVRNRIERQLGGDPRLQARLIGQLDGALSRYSHTIREYGTRSVEAARAANEWGRQLQSVRGVIADKGGLLRNLSTHTNTLRGSIENLGGSMGGFNRLVLNTQVALSALTAAFGIREIAQTAQQLETVQNILRATAPTAEAAAADFQFLREAGDAVGFSFLDAGRSFGQFAAASYNAGVNTEQLQQGFLRLTIASRNLGLSSADTDGVIRALTQSISKGRFTAEEIRNQLGDRLPIAMAALERATGKSREELDKLMRDGKLTTEEFMIPFIEALFQMSGGSEAAARASMSLTASLARLSNAWANLVYQTPALTQGVSGLVEGLTKLAQSNAANEAMNFMGEILRRLGEGFETVVDIMDKTLPAAINTLRNNLDDLTNFGFGALSVALSGLALGAVAAGFAALMTPVGALAVTVGTLYAAFQKYREEVVTYGGQSARVIDIIGASYDYLKEAASAAIDGMAERFERSRPSLDMFVRTIVLAMQRGTQAVASGIDAMITLFAAMPDIARAAANDVEGFFLQMGRNVVRMYENILTNMQSFGTAMAASVRAAFEALKSGEVSSMGTAAAEAFRNSFAAVDILEGTARWSSQFQERASAAMQDNGSTVAQDFASSFVSRMGELTAALSNGLSNVFNPIFEDVMRRAAIRGGSAAERGIATRSLDPGFFGELSDGNSNTRQGESRMPASDALLNQLSGGRWGRGSGSSGSGGSGGSGAANSLREALDDLRREVASAGGDSGAAAQYAQAINRIRDAATSARGSVASLAAEEEARELVTQRLTKELDRYIKDSERTAASNARTARGFMESSAAGEEAEIVTRAYAEALRFAEEKLDDNGNATGRYLEVVNRLIPKIKEAEQSQRNLAASRNIARDRDELQMIEAERRLITARAGDREAELAALRARQENRGASPDTIAQAEQVARRLSDARRETEQLNNSWNEISRTAEQAFDRIGDAITEAFAKGEISAIDFKNVAKAMISEVVQAMLRMAVLNPLLNAFDGGTRGTLGGVFGAMGAGMPASAGGGGMLGSLTNMLGMAGSLNSLTGGGLTGGLSMSSLTGIPLVGSAGLTSATNTALAGMGGSFGPATASQLAAAGAPTIGTILGPAAAGFGAGMLTNTLLGGNQTGGMIGSGLGTAAGIGLSMALGPAAPLGIMASAILGGAAGGGLGGLFGGKQKKAFSGGDVMIAVDSSGQLQISRTVAKGFDMTPIAQQVSQEIDQINAALAEFNVRFEGGTGEFAAVGGGQSKNPKTLQEALRNARFTASDPLVAQAVSGATDAQDAIQRAQWVEEVYKQLIQATDGAAVLARAFEEMNAPFEAAVKTAREYGLETKAVSEAQSKAIEQFYRANYRLFEDAQRDFANRQAAASESPLMAALAERATLSISQERNRQDFTDAAKAQGFDDAKIATLLDSLEETLVAEFEAINRKVAQTMQQTFATVEDQLSLYIGRVIDASGNQEAAILQQQRILEVERGRQAVALEEFIRVSSVGSDLAQELRTRMTQAFEAEANALVAAWQDLWMDQRAGVRGLVERLTASQASLSGNARDEASSNLYAFDTNSVQEMQEVGRSLQALGLSAPEVADALLNLAAAHDMEREAIIRSYEERERLISESLTDRLDAAKSSSEDLSDIIRRFDAQALRERRDAAREGLTDMVMLEQVHAAERARIIEDFAESASQSLRQLGGNIRAFLDGLSTGTVGNYLSPTDQLNASRQLFNRDLTLAQGGNEEALQRITQTAGTFLENARVMFNSTEDFHAIRKFVEESLGNLPATKNYDALILAELEKIMQGTQDQTTAIVSANTSVSSLSEQQLALLRSSDSILARTNENLLAGINIVSAPEISAALGLVQAGVEGTALYTQEVKDAIAVLRTTTADGLITVSEAEQTKAALAALKTVIETSSTNSLKVSELQLSLLRSSDIALTRANDKLLAGIDIVSAPEISAALSLVKAGVEGTALYTQDVKDAISLLRITTADGLITVSEAEQTKAALATIKTVLEAANASSLHMSELQLALLRSSDAILTQTNAQLLTGINIVSAPALSAALSKVQAGVEGTSLYTQEVKDAIALLRTTTEDGLISVSEADQTKAALATLKTVMETANSDAVKSASAIRTALNNQTGQIAAGNVKTDALANLQETGVNTTTDVYNAIVAQTAKTDLMIDVISDGNDLIADLLASFLNKIQETEARQRAEEESRRAAAAAEAARIAAEEAERRRRSELAGRVENVANTASSIIGSVSGIQSNNSQGTAWGLADFNSGGVFNTLLGRSSSGEQRTLADTALNAVNTLASQLGLSLNGFGSVQVFGGGYNPQGYKFEGSGINTGYQNSSDAVAAFTLSALKYFTSGGSQTLRDAINNATSINSLFDILRNNAANGVAFADGGVFERGRVVDRATMSPMALFGEAGPEAIMPLTRAADGSLGVVAVAPQSGLGDEVAQEIRQLRAEVAALRSQMADADRKKIAAAERISENTEEMKTEQKKTNKKGVVSGARAAA